MELAIELAVTTFTGVQDPTRITTTEVGSTRAEKRKLIIKHI